MFDREGCGKDLKPRLDLEAEVEARLQRSGWDNRASAIVLDPELECWVWSGSPKVDRALGWIGRTPTLRAWLLERGFVKEDAIKPSRPKEAMEAALREVRQPRSSAIYEDLATNVSLQRCTDPAFTKLRTTRQAWFPRTQCTRA